jgi:hypothetical protein
MKIITLINRDLKMRLFYGRNQIILQFVFFFVITLFYIFVYVLNDLSSSSEWISFERFWNGFSEEDLESFKQSGVFKIPYQWLIYQLLFFLSLRTFFISDLTRSSGFIIIRSGTFRFAISKTISLFLYTTIYILMLIIFIVIVSMVQLLLFDISLSFISSWKTTIIFCLFLIITLFLEALFFEVISILIGEVIAFIALFSFNFLSLFSKNFLLVSNYSMFSRWNESNVLINNLFFISVWVGILGMICFILMKIIVNKVDYIDEKGEK